MDNSYHVLDGHKRKWLILALEYRPRDDVIRWANKIVREHADHAVILITHMYLDRDGEVADWGSFQKLWDKLITKHSNFAFVFNGHRHGARVHSPGQTPHGNTVHQMLFHGDSLRLLEFRPDGETVVVRDLSPNREEWIRSPASYYRLNLEGLP